MKTQAFVAMLGLLAIGGCDATSVDPATAPATAPTAAENTTINTYAGEKVVKTEDEWRQILTPEQFRVLRRKGTEPPYRNEYNDNKEAGVYVCAGCELELYSSEQKYESGTGWPSFWKPIDGSHIATTTDYDIGYPRTEVLCARCGGHLGHVFDDGPPPTGLRYCMNSAAMKFVKKDE